MIKLIFKPLNNLAFISIINTIFMRFSLRGNISIRNISNKFHSFHILEYSPWPILTAISVFVMILGLVLYMHFSNYILLLIGIFELVICLYGWFSDIVHEACEHTDQVRSGIRLGMILFILSEVMFFFSFFLAYFYCSLSPGIAIGATWPPVNLQNLVIDPFDIPLLNTMLLLSSGVTVTCAHIFLDVFVKFSKIHVFSISNIYARLLAKTLRFTLYRLLMTLSFFWLCITIFLALYFTKFQVLEYVESSIFMSDGIYGSTFYLMTGFHGFHVIMGTILLIVSLARGILGHYMDGNYTGFECSIWYWHFVDVVWLFLYVFIYIWGSFRRVGAFIFPYDNESIFEYISNFSVLNSDFPKTRQVFFQDPATPTMQSIIALHNFISMYLILVLVLVIWIFCACVYFRIENISSLSIDNSSNQLDNKLLFETLVIQNREKFYDI